MNKKTTSFDGVKINYDYKPGRTKTCLVFVHGAGGDLTAWDKEREILGKQGFPTLALDLRGHGLSDRPAKIDDYEVEDSAKDIKTVLENEKITAFDLIGHCFGGVVVMKFQELFPNQARKYIFIDTTAKAPQALKALIFINKPLIVLFGKILNLIKTKPAHNDFDKFIGTNDWDVKRIYSDISHTTLRSWLYTYANFANFNGQSILKSITVPALVIHGEKDTIFPKDNALQIRQLVKGSDLEIIPKENHIIVLNNPEIITNSILNFIKKVPSGLV